MNDDPILFAWMTEDGKWLCRDDLGALTTTDQLDKALVLSEADMIPGTTRGVKEVEFLSFQGHKLLRLRVREARSVKIHEDQLHEM